MCVCVVKCKICDEIFHIKTKILRCAFQNRVDINICIQIYMHRDTEFGYVQKNFFFQIVQMNSFTFSSLIESQRLSLWIGF